MQNHLHFSGSDFFISKDEITPELLQDLLDCGSPGDASGTVAYVRQNYTITGDPETCRGYLRGFGAWEEDELFDHETNLDRLVWLTGCSLSEEDDAAYFSAY